VPKHQRGKWSRTRYETRISQKVVTPRSGKKKNQSKVSTNNAGKRDTRSKKIGSGQRKWAVKKDQ